MRVQAITKYLYKGKEYKTLKEIKDTIHNTIGEEFLDKMQRVCPLEKHKEYLKFLELLCSPEIRSILNECLNVTFDISGEDEDEEEIINVLDLKD